MAFIERLGNIAVIGEHIDANYTENVVLSTYFALPDNYPSDPSLQKAWVMSNCTQTSYSAGSSNAIIPLYKYNPLLPATETTLIMGGVSTFEPDGVRAAWKANLVLNISETVFSNFVRNYSGYYLGFVAIKKAVLADPVAYCLMSWIVEGESLYNIPASAVPSTINIPYIQTTFNLTVKSTKTDEDFGPASEPDGYGQNQKPAYDHTSVTIQIPDPPSVSTASVGFMNVFVTGSGALASLGQYLFPAIGNITDIESALRTLVGIFYSRDCIQYIVDLHAIPVTPTTAGSKYIKIGTIETDISQPYCTSDYVDFNCGSITTPLQYTNFVDFSGCRAKIFIPFVGFVDVAPEYWHGGTLTLKYRFNIIDGSFMAYLFSTSGQSNLSNSLIGQYGGCACLHLPVIATSYGSLVSGIVAGSMSAQGGKGGGITGAVSGALTSYNFMGDMSQSNNYNCSTAYLGGRLPYLLIEREIPCFPTNYPHDKGLPLNVTMSLSAVHGFTVIEDIDLSSITGATENELAELRELLREGVYF